MGCFVMRIQRSRPSRSASIMKDDLRQFGLKTDNSVVIGSGILQALEIRESKDIDLVTTQEIFDHLKKSGKFSVAEDHGREILTDGKYEIGTYWKVLEKLYEFEDFEDESIVIDGVRYITLNFLYRVKKSWLHMDDVREKDTKDVYLIEKYMKKEVI